MAEAGLSGASGALPGTRATDPPAAMPGGPPDAATVPAPATPAVGVLWIAPDRCVELDDPSAPPPGRGYAWVDAHYESPRAWVPVVERLTGTVPLDDHLSDAENPAHPSYFDSTRDYEMIVFRGLAFRPATAPEADPDEPIRIRTRPTVFFLFPRCVVSVRPADSRQVPMLRQRLIDSARFGQRLPARPEELMLRVLNGMVDRYLELRQPLTEQLEHWQRELLDPRKPFRDWVSLLEARRQLRKLENLSEEQLDAIQEWRDERLDRHVGADERAGEWADATDAALRPPAAPVLPPLNDALEVRVNDLVEHVERVRAHAHRLESSVESAVQLHFSATAHRTNQIMRTLTVLTAVFMPLTLITGIFGMNFEVMPGIHSPSGFWWTMAAMGGVALGLIVWFRTRRFIEETGFRRRVGGVRALGASRSERRRGAPRRDADAAGD